jgi:hypothetical protein
MERKVLKRNLFNKLLRESMEAKAEEVLEKIMNSRDINTDNEFDYVEEGEVCNECGSYMKEGECMECGMNEGEVLEKLSAGQKHIAKQAEPKDKIDANDFKMLRSKKKKDMKESEDMDFYKYSDVMGGKVHSNRSKKDDDEYEDFDEEDFKFNAPSPDEYEDFDEEDFKFNAPSPDDMPSYKTKYRHPDDEKIMYELEVEREIDEGDVWEGNEFSGELAKARKRGDEYFTVDGERYKVEGGNKKTVKESALFTENEIISIIERIVKEEKDNIKKGKHKGLDTYNKIHKKSGSESDDYMKSLSKKMNDYQKSSKRKYDMNPEEFPSANDQGDKKAFELSDDGENFNYEIGGLQIPVSDGVDHNDEWIEDNYLGSSRTGNEPGGNALKSKANKRHHEFAKRKTLNKLKNQSYKRVPSPVFNEKPGTEKGKGLNIKLESTNEVKKDKINEEFDKIKNLISYDRKTQ